MNIVIVGYGFVGQAVEHVFKDNATIQIIDPAFTPVEICDIQETADAFFISVPSPSTIDGDCDGSIVIDVVNQISVNVPIIVKSTITPDIINKITNKNVVFNPEFLRAASANADMRDAPFHIIGGGQNQCAKVADIYKQYSICDTSNIIITTPTAASMAKYSINSFLAMKVVWFNQMYEIFEAANANISWTEFTSILQLDSRIGSSHMNVPNNGNFGFGGHCFPKDVAALKSFGENVNVDVSLITHIINANETFAGKNSL